jgi:uncharacterized membrane protein YhaH (DUF805 family)
VNFGQAIKTVFSKYAVFEGKASRAEYWWWFLFNVIVIGGLWLLFLITGGATFLAGLSNATDMSIILLGGFAWALLQLAYLGLAIPNLAVLVRRLRDTGRKAWYLLLLLIPFAGSITILVMTLQPSKTEA